MNEQQTQFFVVRLKGKPLPLSVIYYDRRSAEDAARLSLFHKEEDLEVLTLQIAPAP